MPITLLDFIVLGVILLSALLAMVRGFTREVLSIASWAAAAAATIYFLPDVRGWAQSQINLEPKILADVIAGAGIFLVTLLLVSLVTMRLSDFILDSRIGPFDRALGFLYGGRARASACHRRLPVLLVARAPFAAGVDRELGFEAHSGERRAIFAGHVAGRLRRHHLEPVEGRPARRRRSGRGARRRSARGRCASGGNRRSTCGTGTRRQQRLSARRTAEHAAPSGYDPGRELIPGGGRCKETT